MESLYAAHLQDILLSWDYWELERSCRNGGGPIEELPTIPIQFSSAEEYTSVFEKLLLEECAALLLRGQEEGEVLLSQQAVVSRCDERNDASLALCVALPAGATSSFAENDVLLLSRDDPQSLESTDELHHALAIVEGREGEQSLRVRLKLTEDSQAGNKQGLHRVMAMRAALSPNSRWWVLKLANTSTVLREWAAMHCIGHMPLRDVLFSGKPKRSPIVVEKMGIPDRMLAALKTTYNDSQINAVTSGLEGTSMVLIQGPPGTGKTKTILGLLSIIIHSAPRGAFGSSSAVSTAAKGSQVGGRGKTLSAGDRHRIWAASCPWLSGKPDPRERVVPPERADPRNAFGMLSTSVPVRIGAADRIKARILVCAPANSALDELVLRIITAGLADKDGQVYTPSVVRVGVNIHHSVRSVSLDTLVEQRLGDGNKDASSFEKSRLRMSILEEANIVCTTLAFSGSSAFTRLTKKFDVVIIDEAAQAVEPATLVPLAHGDAKQVYLVGDPVQLPATVLSQRALAHGYSNSLFKRLQSAGYPVQVLDTQYRMHPRIREFPSRMFYGDTLLDGPNVLAETTRPWHDSPAFQPLTFYDVPGKEATPGGSNSLSNRMEADAVLSLYRELVHRYPELRTSPAVAIISPYKAQVTLLRDIFFRALGPDLFKMVDINSIDGFQGREKDVAIFSTVRSSRRGSIGFVADERRVNVGLTRARTSLLVVGNAAALKQDDTWKALVEQAAQAHCLYSVRLPVAQFIGRVADGTEMPVTAAHAGTSPEMVPEAMEEDDDAYLYSEDEDTIVQPTTVKQGAWVKQHAH